MPHTRKPEVPDAMIMTGAADMVKTPFDKERENIDKGNF